MSEETKNTPERASATSKLESMQKEELVKLVQSQMLLKKKLSSQIEDLTQAKASLCVELEKIQNALDDETAKSNKLSNELEQVKLNEAKAQQELATLRESLECISMQNDTFKLTCQNFQEEMNKLNSVLSDTRASLEAHKNTAAENQEKSQQTIVDLSNANELLKNEIQHLNQIKNEYESGKVNLESEKEDLSFKLNQLQRDCSILEEEKVHLRNRVQELEDSMKSSAFLSTHVDLNEKTIIPEHFDSLVNQMDHQECDLSSVANEIMNILKSKEVLEHFSSRVIHFEGLVRFFSKVTHYCDSLEQRKTIITQSINTELPSLISNEENETLEIEIPRKTTPAFDQLIDYLLSWQNQENNKEMFRLILSRSKLSMNENQPVSLNIDGVQFFSSKLAIPPANISQLEYEQQKQELQGRQKTIDELKENMYKSDEHLEALRKKLDEQEQKATDRINQLDEQYNLLAEQHQQLVDKNGQLEEDLREHQNLTAKNTKQNEESKEKHDELIQQLEKDINTYKSQLESLQNKLDEEQQRAANRINENDERYSRLMEEHQQLRESSERQMAEFKDSIDKNVQLEKESEDYKTSISEKEKEFEQILREKEATIVQMRSEMEDYRHRLAALQNDLDDEQQRSTSRIDEVEERYNLLIEQNRKLTEKCEELQKNVELAENQPIDRLVEERDENIRQLQAQIDASKEEKEKLLVDFDHRYKDLTTQYESLEQTFEQKKVEIQELNEKNVKLLEELKQKQVRDEEKPHETNEYDENDNEVNRIRTDFESYRLSQEISFKKLEEEHRCALAKATEIEEQYNMLSEEHQQIRQLLETQTEEIKQMTDRNIQLEESLTKSQHLIMENKQQTEVFGQQREELLKCEETVRQLRCELDESRKQMELLRKKLDEDQQTNSNRIIDLDDRYKLLIDENQHLKETNVQLEQNLINHRTLLDEEKTQQEKVRAESEKVIEQFRIEVQDYRTQLESMKTKLDEEQQRSVNQIEEIEERYNALLDKNQQLTEKNTQLEEDLKEHESWTQENSKQNDDSNEKLRKEIEDYRNQIENLEKTFDDEKRRAQQNIDESDQRYNVLLKQHQQLSELLENKISDVKQLKERNTQLEQDLEEHRTLVFDKTKQADDLDRQFQRTLCECNELKTSIDRSTDEKNKLVERIQILNKEITLLQNEKVSLSEEIEQKTIQWKNQLQSRNETIDEEKSQLERKLNEKIVQLENQLKTIQLEEQSKVETLESRQAENQQEKEIIKELENTINQLKNQIEQKTQDFEKAAQENKDKQQKMKILLARLKKELEEKSQQPKQSLIDLELADYEKTIKTLKESLTTKDKEIDDLRLELSATTEKMGHLNTEIQNLEQLRSETDERANKFKTLYETTKKELQDAKDLENERHHNDGNVRTLMDKLQYEADNSKLLINNLIKEKQALTERLEQQLETQQRAIAVLEQNLHITQHDLDISRKDYESLQDDFQNYKIRAQMVLKQQQQQQSNAREPTRVSADRNEELEETIVKLKTTLDEAKNKIQSLIGDNQLLQQEQERLVDLHARLTNDTKKREQDLRKQHQTELDRVESDYKNRIIENDHHLKLLVDQNESLSKSCKDQIMNIESDHHRTVSLLQNQLQAAKQEIEQMKNRIEVLRQNTSESEKDATTLSNNNDQTRDDLLWNSFERQQGEGSESTTSDQPSADIAAKTLENVLFGKSTNSNTSNMQSEKPRHVLFEDIELERQRLEEELTKTKQLLLNTTELLNESEFNNLRLVEQVSLLKDEIRRIERNMERVESVSNLEYLKNIILKFFTLKSSAERLQLIPVLVTMLRLSPDEQAKLVRVAQQTASIDSQSPTSNDSDTQPVANPTNPNPAGTSSWSSYLHIW